MITTFLTSSLVIFVNIKNKKILLTIFGFASIVMTIGYFKPSEFYYPDDKYFLNKMLPLYQIEEGQLVSSSEYQNYSEDYLLLPRWVDYRPISMQASTLYARSNTLDVIMFNKKNEIDYYADVSGSGVLVINKLYFPGWYSEIDDTPASIEILKPSKSHRGGDSRPACPPWSSTGAGRRNRQPPEREWIDRRQTICISVD